MLLQPRKIYSKSLHKKRNIKKQRLNRFRLSFGSVGISLLQPLRINSKKLFRLKLFLKRSSRRGDKTGRKVWLNSFPHLPLTKKSIGSRMGKSKGKLSIWHAQLYVGLVLVEFKNLRIGRALYYIRRLKFKMKSLFRIFYRDLVWVDTSLSKSKRTIYQTFW